MSNKVQVIFTFELVSHERKEVQGGVEITDGVSVSVKSQGLSNVDKGGPQHAYALILKHNAHNIVRFLTDEVKLRGEKFGFEINTRSEEITEASDNIH
ncbi:hypothetical protein [Salmonella enterica]|uniref:Uncharacterized protein n=1 Tax=Salmonella enterica subsp. salamae serovar 47:b:1,5 TaxID=1967619 RepID=A0A701UK77_SALER|nr:hypothetical protein [Salmonella enterica]EJY4049081.1 hypothetical protein [Salmonella enterica]HAC6515038.1 hypothetical protein [Salmonella enterica subsp. salamae serovar 47:b:1,5]HAE2324799.1 hypothetical protein [Salmonella enterica subsp. diarizonae serovar 65:(k):z]